MKFFISILLIALLSFAACLYLPWWMIAIAGFIVSACIPQRSGTAFLSGFFAGFLLWAGMSFWISSTNDHLFAHKISILILKTDNIYVLIAATGLIGGMVAGLGALTGSFLRRKKTVTA